MPDNTAKPKATDRTAFQTLYDQQHDRILSRAAGWVRDRERAEDITAAAFQTAWAKREQFRGDSALATWLHAIAFNEARDGWRRDPRGRTVSIDEPGAEQRAAPGDLESSFERSEQSRLLWAALQRIPAKYRRLLVGRYIEGRPLQEIARRERVPLGTIGSRLFTASQLVREAWATPTPLGGSMPSEKVREIAEEALKRLAEELQAGRSDALKTYLAAMGRFHRYSWNNVMLIQAQRPAATRVAGYHSWHDLGRFVRKGEKGIMIFAPIVRRTPEPENPDGRAERQAAQESGRRVTGFRTAYVFDAGQTDGKPLPEFAKTAGDPKEFGDKLKAIVAQRAIALEYDASIAPAQGVSSGGRIRLLPNLSPAEEFSVLAHELAHETLHHKHDESARLPKVVRETQAEAVAYVVCRGVGLQTNTTAADYIALYNGDTKTLADSLAAIQETASRILKDLLPEERAAPDRERRSQPDPTTRTSPEQPTQEPTDSAADRAPSGSTPFDAPSLDR